MEGDGDGEYCEVVGEGRTACGEHAATTRMATRSARRTEFT